MENYLQVVRKSVENGVIARCHLEDITRADFYGFIYENRPHAKQSILIIILVCPYLFKRCFSQKNK